MKRLTFEKILLVMLAFAVFFSFGTNIKAENTVDIHFFYDEICGHCDEADVFLTNLAERDDVTLHRYEVTGEDANAILFDEVCSVFDMQQAQTPFIVVGGLAFYGFNDQTKRDIEQAVVRYESGDYVDVVGKIINGEEIDESYLDDPGFEEGDLIDIPLIGTVDIGNLSLVLAAVVIGIVDGFNPCALWVLVFLITMLLQTKNKKRMWILGSVFIFISAFVYFLFMEAWLQVAFRIVSVNALRMVIGLLAFGFGAYQFFKAILSYKKKDVGCDVTDETRRRSIMVKTKKIVREASLIPALLGIIALAFTVNLIELACSLGLPLLFTQILAFHQLPAMTYHFYILLYVFFFMLDDLIIFTLAMVTLEVTGVSNRYTKLTKLIGAVIMLVLGLVLVFFPEWLMM